jgi:hypothetical protein
VSNWPHEETDEPLIADHRNYYRVERMLFAGSNLATAQAIFAAAIKHRPRIRLTIRQRTRVLDEWPE